MSRHCWTTWAHSLTGLHLFGRLSGSDRLAAALTRSAAPLPDAPTAANATTPTEWRYLLPQDP